MKKKTLRAIRAANSARTAYATLCLKVKGCKRHSEISVDARFSIFYRTSSSYLLIDVVDKKLTKKRKEVSSCLDYFLLLTISS